MGDGASFYTLHGIDINKEKPDASAMKGTTAALEEWKDALVAKIYEGEKRRFKFDSDTCEVIALVRKITNHTDREGCALRIAERLLHKEKGAQQKMAHLVEIQKGALFQILTKHEGNPAYLLAKVEHEEILDEFDMEKHSGLPFNKQIFKTCFITFDDENQLLDVLVSDNRRKKISDYWSYDFLEVRELTTNEHNTRVAFKILDTYVTKLKKKHPADYIHIRNNLVGYFRTSETFSYSDMVERVVGSYEPEDTSLDINKFKTGLEEIPSKMKDDTFFEETFGIIKSVITARFKKSIDLSDKITLKFREDIDNLDTVIKSVIYEGKKCIRIETEQGYNYFRKEEQVADAPV